MELAPDYVIVVWNDESSVLEYVIVLMMKVFDMDELEAFEKSREVHENDSAVVWEGSYEIGEVMMEQCNSVKLEYFEELGNLMITLEMK